MEFARSPGVNASAVAGLGHLGCVGVGGPTIGEDVGVSTLDIVVNDGRGALNLERHVGHVKGDRHLASIKGYGIAASALLGRGPATQCHGLVAAGGAITVVAVKIGPVITGSIGKCEIVSTWCGDVIAVGVNFIDVIIGHCC